MWPQKGSEHRPFGKWLVARFLITLLILPSLPEQAVCYQRRIRYYSNPDNDGATRDFIKGYSRRTYLGSTPHYLSFPSRRPYPTMLHPAMNASQNFHHHHHQRQGMIILQQAGSLPPPQPYVMEQVPQIIHMHRKKSGQAGRKPTEYPVALKNSCPGHKNLIDDIGVLSLITAMMSSTFGLYTILVNSMTSNNIGIVSGFMSLVLWIPSTIITVFNLSGDQVYALANVLNQLSFVNSMYGFMGVIFGTADVLASAAGESVGIFSFILSVVATFPELLEAILKYLYRVGDNNKAMEYYVENYGCSVPRIFTYLGRPFYKIVNDFLVHTFDEHTN